MDHCIPRLSAGALLLLALLAGCSGTPGLKLRRVEPVPFQSRHVISVMDFENRTGIEEHDALRSGLGDMLISELMEYECFRLVERRRLAEVLNELDLNITGYIHPESVKEIGNLLGVDALLFCKDKANVEKTEKISKQNKA
jgi:curli biogenesis system outer membrane secretion channel CsgG